MKTLSILLLAVTLFGCDSGPSEADIRADAYADAQADLEAYYGRQQSNPNRYTYY